MKIARARTIGAIAAIGALVLFAYVPVVGNGFVSFDDPSYITANPPVAGGLSVAGLRWALSTFHMGNWHPLTWLSHMLDVSLFGLRPAGHHAMSLLFHAANTLLVFAALRSMTGSSLAERVHRGGLRRSPASRRIGRLGRRAQGRPLDASWACSPCWPG